ncbi:helix-turn-helix domain-containing protein [Streptomyces mobaraensis NBRC 13819 = DSM 40847]|uniref:Helix-turn-helix domain-containing protein n=2 Tax=Streptomyces mobaraensis TaxID=35621 RepID=A0A5N5WGY6_STRMB|nr:helix-turn-helix domain-containing protein [Streptomyces mobaraensis]KAB7852804.1 helix-turn-helix domain-containing protein [Streptomyces mobaraensis]QTT75309.1 helix-turn-helix domain-containing protein [Streptomyces mobaraensis NBRC 13819 = DSM 40847]
MPRWKELPASLDQRVSQFVVQLRRLKDRSGLSLAALAAKTSYSRSSWERYLNGRQLPPRGAVEELARVCGADPARLLVLHEIAEEAWPSAASAASASLATSAASGTSPTPASPPDAVGLQEARRRLWLYVAAVAVLVVALAAALLAARPWKDDDAQPKADAPSAVGSPSPFVFVQGRSRPCRVERRGGELWAGYSPTRTVLMDLKSSGWEVLEAQCLLKYHGFDPGLTDGSFGPRSKAAAERFQKAKGLVVDGIVGPDTWKELRR